MRPFMLLALFMTGCVTPADDSRAIGVSRTGWLDNKVQGLADRSMDRARETILIPALQGMVDGLKNQQRSESATTHSVGVLMPGSQETPESPEIMSTMKVDGKEVPDYYAAEMVRKHYEEQRKKEPETDQPDDVLTVRECTPTQCFGLFTIRRNQLQALEVAAGGRGRHVTIVNVKRSVSVVKTKATSPCGCPDCVCVDCQCLKTKTVTVTRGYSPIVYESTPTYTTTYRTRWRPFGRWRR